MSQRLQSIIVLVLAIAFAVSPYLSGGFNGFEPSQFPVSSPWPAQPAGWAFSIWLVIYLALIGAALIGMLRGDTDWARVGPPLAASLLIGVFWIAAANRVPVIATGMIIAMAAFAVAAWFRRGPHLWQAVPLGLYAGWLTAAAGVAISAVLTGFGLLDAQIAAVTMLIVVCAVALIILTRPGAGWSYAPAPVWALTGVIAANASPVNLPVIAVCVIGIIALAIVAFRRNRT